jgi:vancomycin resistance protein YoaR
MKKKLLAGVIIGGIIGLLIATGAAFAKAYVHGKFSPGTVVGGVDISYKTPEEATEVLTKKKDEYMGEKIKIAILGEVKEFLPEELGIEILVAETISTIRETDARALGLFTTIIKNSGTKNEKELAIKIETEKLKTTISEAFGLEEIRPTQASLYFDNEKNLKIKEEKEGKEIKEDLLIKELRENAKRFSSEKILVETESVSPTITTKKLEEIKEDLDKKINKRITLVDPVYRDPWIIKLRDRIDWIIFEETLPATNILNKKQENGYAIEIKIDEKKLNEYIDEHMSKWLDREVENVNIYKDENEKIIIEGRGSEGKEIQRRMLKEAIELAIKEGIAEVIVPVLDIVPEVKISEELQDLGIKEVVGIGHTSYYGSPANRVHNIKVSAERFNGKLIAPGEIFSFNTNLGPVNGAMGYRKELVIKPEGTIPEYGGGVCQTSTTLYRAALLTGLPITERHPHSYAVTYYSQVLGHGLDATIYLGGPDLKFKNDTEGHLLLQAYTKNDYELYMVFYGTSDGRKVEMDGPRIWGHRSPGATIYQETDTLAEGQTKQVEKAHTGFRADWTRRVTFPDKETIEEIINTNYRAIPAKILVGKKSE